MIDKTKNTVHSGITLVELILYVALFMIFITGVVTFGIEIIGIRAKARVQQEVIHNSRAVAKRIAFEVRNASAINSVTATSISLANADTNRNPTVITKSGNRITISWGSTGPPCPLASPCFLTSSDVNVNEMTFTNMSDGGANSASVKFALTISSVNPGGRKDWSYSQSMIGNAELRSK
jgi:hypothetical protein